MAAVFSSGRLFGAPGRARTSSSSVKSRLRLPPEAPR
jgi:hypothetical protein